MGKKSQNKDGTNDFVVNIPDSSQPKVENKNISPIALDHVICRYCQQPYMYSTNEPISTHGCSLEKEIAELTNKVDNSIPALIKAIENLKEFLTQAAIGNNVHPDIAVLSLHTFKQALDTAIHTLREAA